ncbi:MAG: DUF11 domain-containing protein [Henriciella sp.]|nr:DUF11 domain-containing protein [Henriciella sp.]
MLRAAILALALTGLGVAPAGAAGLTAVQTVEVATVSVDASGAEQLSFAPATDVEPGEQVRYRLAFTNEGDAPAEGVSLVMPVPGEVTLLEDTIEGAASAVMFSADNGDSFALRTATLIADGDRMRVATAAEITHIKWDFAEPVAAGASGAISFMAVLN